MTTLDPVSKRKNFIDMTWRTFWRRTIVKRTENNSKGIAMRHCRCVCWNEKIVDWYVIRRWQSTSCGCAHEEIITSHWFAKRTNGKKTRIYNIYQVMRKRCNNKNDDHYKDYWWRWIKCMRNCFEEFYKDMWMSYEHHVREFWEKNTSIDRIDVNWHYCVKNCRRATAKEQANNRRNTRLPTKLRKMRNLNNDPLTRGRICHLSYPKLWNNKVHSREDTRCEEMWKLLINIEDLLFGMQSFDQNELQRMKHKRWQELRSLLIKFTKYI